MNGTVPSQGNNAMSSSAWTQNLPPSYSVRSLPELSQTTAQPYAAYLQAQYNDVDLLRGCDEFNVGGGNALESGLNMLSSQSVEFVEDSVSGFASVASNYRY